MKKLLTVLAIGVVSAGVAACSSSTSPAAPSAVTQSSTNQLAAKPGYAEAAKPGAPTIVGIVLQEDGEFDVLQAAVVRAGLVEALNGTQQYTVFAPTDAAFVTTLGVANEAAAIAAVNSLDLDTLKNIPASQVEFVRMIRPGQSSGKYGNQNAGGVIEVTSKKQ